MVNHNNPNKENDKRSKFSPNRVNKKNKMEIFDEHENKKKTSNHSLEENYFYESYNISKMGVEQKKDSGDGINKEDEYRSEEMKFAEMKRDSHPKIEPKDHEDNDPPVGLERKCYKQGGRYSNNVDNGMDRIEEKVLERKYQDVNNRWLSQQNEVEGERIYFSDEGLWNPAFAKDSNNFNLSHNSFEGRDNFLLKKKDSKKRSISTGSAEGISEINIDDFFLTHENAYNIDQDHKGDRGYTNNSSFNPFLVDYFNTHKQNTEVSFHPENKKIDNWPHENVYRTLNADSQSRRENKKIKETFQSGKTASLQVGNEGMINPHLQPYQFYLNMSKKIDCGEPEVYEKDSWNRLSHGLGENRLYHDNKGNSIPAKGPMPPEKFPKTKKDFEHMVELYPRNNYEEMQDQLALQACFGDWGTDGEEKEALELAYGVPTSSAVNNNDSFLKKGFIENESSLGPPARIKEFSAMFVENAFCKFCNKGGRMIYCQRCGEYTHLKCVSLKRAPAQGWHCKDCMAQINKERPFKELCLNGLVRGGVSFGKFTVVKVNGKAVFSGPVPENIKRCLQLQQRAQERWE